MASFTPDTHETPVIFRKWPKSQGGGVIALFPAEPARMTGVDSTSYQHVGQHGAACPSIIYDTKPAKPAEYADLLAELEGAPFGYRLKVYKRITSQHRSAHRAEQRRFTRHAG